MNHFQKAAVLLRLADSLRAKGSWCGETHLQKATFFLQDMLGVRLGYDFILYKHGPFSFDLKEDLSSFLADDLFEYEIKRSNYGPSIIPGPRSHLVREQYPKTSDRYSEQVGYVAQVLGNKNVKDLEKLATAFFVKLEANGEADPDKKAARLHELKPHIPFKDSLNAVEEIETICRQAQGMCVI
jgi:hypothetical protein